ncbi:MAG: hypothetical protein ACO38P_09880, partial [Phycisphaerales bacterium]
MDIPSRYPSGSRTASPRTAPRTAGTSGAIGREQAPRARLRDQGVHRVGGSADSPAAAAPLEEGRKMNTTTVRP